MTQKTNERKYCGNKLIITSELLTYCVWFGLIVSVFFSLYCAVVACWYACAFNFLFIYSNHVTTGTDFIRLVNIQ